MLNYLYVALGSAAGGVARWSVGNWVQRLAGGLPPVVFPVGTLVVNTTGSFILGLLVSLIVGALALILAPGAAALDIADASPPTGVVGSSYSYTFQLSPGSGSAGASWSGVGA